MTKAEAWQQCSARGTTVTRLAYIMGFNPSCVGDGRRERQIKGSRERGTSESQETPRIKLGVPFFLLCSSIFYLKFSPL